MALPVALPGQPYDAAGVAACGGARKTCVVGAALLQRLDRLDAAAAQMLPLPPPLRAAAGLEPQAASCWPSADASPRHIGL